MMSVLTTTTAIDPTREFSNVALSPDVVVAGGGGSIDPASRRRNSEDPVRPSPALVLRKDAVASTGRTEVTAINSTEREVAVATDESSCTE